MSSQNDPKHKYYELPLGEPITEEELQEEVEAGLETLKKLIEENEE